MVVFTSPELVPLVFLGLFGVPLCFPLTRRFFLAGVLVPAVPNSEGAYRP